MFLFSVVIRRHEGGDWAARMTSGRIPRKFWKFWTSNPQLVDGNFSPLQFSNNFTCTFSVSRFGNFTSLLITYLVFKVRQSPQIPSGSVHKRVDSFGGNCQFCVIYQRWCEVAKRSLNPLFLVLLQFLSLPSQLEIVFSLNIWIFHHKNLIDLTLGLTCSLKLQWFSHNIFWR